MRTAHRVPAVEKRVRDAHPTMILATVLVLAVFAGAAHAQDEIFSDGFESGDLSAWSSTSGG